MRVFHGILTPTPLFPWHYPYFQFVQHSQQAQCYFQHSDVQVKWAMHEQLLRELKCGPGSVSTKWKKITVQEKVWEGRLVICTLRIAPFQKYLELQ